MSERLVCNRILALKQGGISLIEILVGLVLFLVMALGLTLSLQTGIVTREHTLHNARASAIATDTLERLLARSPSDLSASDSKSDVVNRGGNSYTRKLVVKDVADETIYLSVQVAPVDPRYKGVVTLSTSVAVRGAK